MTTELFLVYLIRIEKDLSRAAATDRISFDPTDFDIEDLEEIEVLNTKIINDIKKNHSLSQDVWPHNPLSQHIKQSRDRTTIARSSQLLLQEHSSH